MRLRARAVRPYTVLGTVRTRAPLLRVTTSGCDCHPPDLT